MTNPFKLLAQVERLREKTISQQDEIRHLKRELENALDDRAEAVKGSSLAWEQIANWLAKRSGLGAISMSPNAIPDAPQPEMESVERKPLGRDVVNEMSAKFEQDMNNYIREQMEHQDGGDH